MKEVTLAEILQSREARVHLQNRLRNQYHCSVISFTMNIAGPVKNTPLIQRGFLEGRRLLEESLPKESILHQDVQTGFTGCQAVYAVSMDAAELKDLCVSIEDGSALGRLFDMDVLAADGRKLSRNNLRGCIVCGAPGRTCAAGRAHSVPQLQQATHEILSKHFLDSDQRFIAGLAVKSLVEEVTTTPKPGLVDRRNNGSHKDMTIDTFLASAEALEPFFRDCIAIGAENRLQSSTQVFLLLRQAGLRAETIMYQATGGVNTHKGVIFSMGILCAALGSLWTPGKIPTSLPNLFNVCGKIAEYSVKNDFNTPNQTTAGLRLFRELQIPGIRGETAAGFPSVQNIAIPAFQRAKCQGATQEEAGIYALLHLIVSVQDTNLYHRGGIEGASWAVDSVKKLLNLSKFPTRSQLETLDDAFILRNLSPGGCADLLAVTYFVFHLEREGYLFFEN